MYTGGHEQALEHPYLAFNVGLEFSGGFIRAIVMMMGMALATSTADTLCFGILGIMKTVAPAMNKSRWSAPLLALCVSVIPAIFVASQNLSLLSLFMLANLATAIIAPPVFVGTLRRPSRVGVLLGITASSAVAGAFHLWSSSLENDITNRTNLAMFSSIIVSGASVSVLCSTILTSN